MLSRLMTRKEQLVLLCFAGAVAVGALALIYHGSLDTEAGLPPAIEAPASVPVSEPVASKPELVVEPEPEKDAAVVVEPVAPTEPAEVAVAVAGEVANSGMYILAEGARVSELLEKAGGATELADLSDINLAARLLDGTTLIVPARPAPGVRRRFMSHHNPPSYTISGWQPPRTPAAREPAVPPDQADPAAPPAQAAATPGLVDLNHASREELESLPGIGPVLAGEIMRYRERGPFASVEDLGNVSGIGPQKLAAVRRLVTVR